MTRDDIIRMAYEASDGVLSYDAEGRWILSEQEVIQLAALVAAEKEQQMIRYGYRQCAKGQRTTQFCGLLDAAVKAEREACLALVNQGTGEATSADALKILRMERDRISAAIRARGEV